jgi:hypothetical protein
LILRGGILLALLGVCAPWAGHAQTNVVVEWSVEQKLEPPTCSAHSSSSTGPVVIQLDESGLGESPSFVPRLEQTVRLKPPFDQLCHLRGVTNPPIKISVKRETIGGGRYWVKIERQDPPTRGFICSVPGMSPGPAGIALLPVGEDSFFPLAELQPGVPKSHDLKRNIASNVVTVQNEIRLTVSPCAPKAGSSGDGSVLLKSTPPLGQNPWPVTETFVPLKQLQPRAAGTPDKIVLGVTGPIFPDSKEARDPNHAIVPYRTPRTRAQWLNDDAAGGICFYLDTVELGLPEIEVYYPKEFWDARDSKCWFGAVRWHEQQHVSVLETIYRQLQEDIDKLAHSPGVPSPGKPAFAHDEAEMERIKAAFSDPVQTLLAKAKADVLDSARFIDDLNAYAIENGYCAMPTNDIQQWLR